MHIYESMPLCRRGPASVAAIWILLALLAPAAGAQVLTVCPDGSGAYLTIQAALDAAPAGAVIELCDGVYSGPGNRDLVMGDRFLTVRSASGDPEACVIDAGGSESEPHRGFLFQAAAGLDTCAVIEGITVRNGWAEGGGGVRCETGFSNTGGGPLLRDCRIVECKGGGIGVHLATLRLERCQVSENVGSNLVMDLGVVWAADSELSGASGNGIDLEYEGGPANRAVLRLSGCSITGNGGAGIALGIWSLAYVDSCEISGNGWGVYKPGAEDCSARFSGCRISGNVGGAWLGDSVWAEFIDCEVVGNGTGGGLTLSFALGQYATRCLVQQNGGDGIRFGSPLKSLRKDPAANGPVTDCTILENGGWGVFASGWLSDLDVSGTLIAGNVSGGVHIDVVGTGMTIVPALTSCTIAGNGGPGVDIVGADGVTIDRTIIAFNQGPAIATIGIVPTLSCSDLYGNTGGDWTAPIAAQLGTAGNFSADPLFCHPEADDYRLAAGSPAAAAQAPAGCGLIGARPVGCDVPWSPVPRILSIADIPQDQGLQVRVTWSRDPRDVAGSAVAIARYVVWRRVQESGPVPPADRPLPEERPSLKLLGEGDPPRLRAYAALWEPVGPEVPGMGWERYASTVPTLHDSTAAGIAWSVFLVSAHATDPQLFFLSAPDSGWSVDNLTPAAPLGFAVAYGAAGNLLRWLPHTAPDFVAFRIYRGEGNSFPLSQATLVQTTVLTEWTDPVADPWRWGYRITAVDDAGLESAAAMPATITAVPGAGTAGDLPARPILQAAAPNPFNPRTSISYALPAGGAEVRLEVFDLAGRRLRVLESGFRDAGRHEVVWDGADAQGRPVSAGVYFCRLQTAGATGVLKLALVR